MWFGQSKRFEIQLGGSAGLNKVHFLHGTLHQHDKVALLSNGQKTTQRVKDNEEAEYVPIKRIR